jgi:hypothetical protein
VTRKVSARIDLDMPRSQAWNRLRDISLAHNYVPGVTRTEILGEQTEGVGASRYVYLGAKKYLQETVVEWREGEGFVLRLHKGDKPAPPFRHASFHYSLADEGSSNTLLTTSLEFEMPWGALGRWLEKRMEKLVRSSTEDVAIALKLFYESDQPTTASKLKAYKAAARS